MHGSIRRVIALGVTFCFIFNAVGYGNISPAVLSATPPLSIPRKLGQVEETKIFPPRPSPDHPYLIHIQDAHGNPQGERHIAGIIKYLVKTQGITTVFVEGASEELKTEYLQFIPDQDLNQKLLDRLVDLGELTGVELALFNKGLRAFGIEEAGLYRQNFELFRSVMGEKKASESFIKTYRRALDRKASRVFSKDLLRLVRHDLEFDQRRARWTGMLGDLDRMSARVLDRDLHETREQIEFPNLVRFYRLKEEEGTIDLEQARQEWQEIRKSYQLNLDFFSDKRNPRRLLENLHHLLSPRGFKFELYPEFTRQARNRIFQYEIQSTSFFEEIQRLMEMLFDAMAVREEEKRIIREGKQFKLIRKLLSLELTRKEYDEAEASGACLPDRQARPNLGDRRSPLRFYQTAIARESIFMQKISEHLKRRRETQAILVTGGFHTEGLKRFFNERQISHTIIRPKLEEPGADIYRESMMRGFEDSSLLKFLVAQPGEAQSKSLGQEAYQARMQFIQSQAASLGIQDTSLAERARLQQKIESFGIPNMDGLASLLRIEKGEISPFPKWVFPSDQKFSLGDEAFTLVKQLGGTNTALIRRERDGEEFVVQVGMNPELVWTEPLEELSDRNVRSLLPFKVLRDGRGRWHLVTPFLLQEKQQASEKLSQFTQAEILFVLFHLIDAVDALHHMGLWHGHWWPYGPNTLVDEAGILYLNDFKHLKNFKHEKASMTEVAYWNDWIRILEFAEKLVEDPRMPETKKLREILGRLAHWKKEPLGFGSLNEISRIFDHFRIYVYRHLVTKSIPQEHLKRFDGSTVQAYLDHEEELLILGTIDHEVSNWMAPILGLITQLYTKTKDGEITLNGLGITESDLNKSYKEIFGAHNMIKALLIKKQLRIYQYFLRIRSILRALRPIAAAARKFEQLDESQLNHDLLKDFKRQAKLIISAEEGLAYFINFVRRKRSGDGKKQKLRMVDLNDVASASAGLYRKLSSEVNLNVEPSQESLRTTLFSLALVSILGNLIRNATRYRAKNIWIDLKPDPTNQHAIIRVSNDGDPILPEHLPRLFQVGFSTRSPSAGERGGMGLALSKRFLEINGGDISVTSEPGNTVFTIHVPLADGASLGEKEQDLIPKLRRLTDIVSVTEEVTVGISDPKDRPRLQRGEEKISAILAWQEEQGVFARPQKLAA